jgi:hypothetical protein
VSPESLHPKEAVNNEFGEHQAVYRVIPGDRSYEIETAVWIWPVSYYVL